MATYKNINKSTNVVSVGRTAPVPRGVQTKNNSLPVVLASDADPVPVVEQNKILSEVALSLLGIPRSEVALGIFADVNTYDVNPSEWSIKPIDRQNFTKAGATRPYEFSQEASGVNFQHGLTHIPEEAGALVEAPPNETAVLTSKRFFRYQPGRVSAATFGVKESFVDHITSGPARDNRNPAIRKFGIYDNFDGYYWETRDTGKGDQFGVTRRTQSIIDYRNPQTEYTSSKTDDYAIVGKGNSTELVCTMHENSAHSSPSGTTISIPVADIDAQPEVGMTIQNITNASPSGILVNPDTQPLFAANTIVTSVATGTGHGTSAANNTPVYLVGINQSSLQDTVTIRDTLIDSSTGDFSTTVTDAFGQKNGGGTKKLKFTRAGELAIIRDNLMMTQAGIYDPSLLKDPVLNEIQSVSGDSFIFQLPNGPSYKSEEHSAYVSTHTNSPNGLRVNEVFEVGQFVQYTSDATVSNIVTGNDTVGAAGKTLIHGDSPSTFMIREINMLTNSIRLSGIPSIDQDNESPLNLGPDTNLLATSAGTFSTTKHFIKTPVPFIFPQVDTTSTQNCNDIMFPYSRTFDVDRTAITGTDHRGNSSKVGLLDTNLAGTGSEIQGTLFDNFKQDVNDLNKGLTACTYASGLGAGSANQTYSDAQANVNDGKITSGWRYFVQQNVKPDFYGVYEYKIPRSRFSFDSLDADSGEEVFYSDITKVAGSIKYPGQPVGGDDATRDSLWDIDFGKVIMKKIEFSWYGAVGALFLAYVPVGNGEARWIRVHHLRASNQLKVASLGNATLPLTYTVFGGGTPKTLGNASYRTSGYAGGKSASEFITKYGSSYYIDGGDRGTVRLFNFAPAAPTKVAPSTFKVKLIDNPAATGTDFLYSYSPAGDNALAVGSHLGNPTGTGKPGPTDILIGGTITNSAGTSTAKIDFVDRRGFGNPGVHTSVNSSPSVGKIFLNKSFTNTLATGDGYCTVTVEPGVNLYGLQSKTEIQSSQDFKVRNRVQVYPTKLSAGMSTANGQKEVVSVALKKNVKFQTDQVHNLRLAGVGNAIDAFTFKGTGTALNLESSGLPTRLTSSNSSPFEAVRQATGAGDCPTIPIGTEFFGHARVADSLDNQFTLFAKIKKSAVDGDGKGIFDFIPLEPYSGTAKFVNNTTFTHSLQYNNEGEMLTSAITADTEEIERLSSVTVDNQIRRAIPGTGTRVAEFFLEDGSDYFDLQAYFDYNKDYISFPLTDEPDNLYLEAKINHLSQQGSNVGDTPSVAVSLTWEEQ